MVTWLKVIKKYSQIFFTLTQMKRLPMRSQVKSAAAGKLPHPMINPTLFASLFHWGDPISYYHPISCHSSPPVPSLNSERKQFKREMYASHF